MRTRDLYAHIRIDSSGATAIQLPLTPDDAQRCLDVIDLELCADHDELLRSLKTRIGTVAEGGRAGSVVITEREYVVLDSAANAGESDSCEVVAERLEQGGVGVNPGQTGDHRVRVNESQLPK